MLSVLDPRRIAAYTDALAAALAGAQGSYFDALNRIQHRFPIDDRGAPRCAIEAPGPGGPRLLFELDEHARAFLARVLEESQLPGLPVQRLSPDDERDARDRVAAASRLLRSYHPEIPASLRRLIGTLLFARVEGCAGGSSAHALGTVWISPGPDWTIARYAECLCHELVHQALFLEDMLAPVFRQVEEEEPRVISSIRRCKRPYECSFHAAAVAGALVEMYQAIDLGPEAAAFLPGLADSVAEFRTMPEYLTPRGLEVLSELGQIALSVPTPVTELA